MASGLDDVAVSPESIKLSPRSKHRRSGIGALTAASFSSLSISSRSAPCRPSFAEGEFCLALGDDGVRLKGQSRQQIQHWILAAELGRRPFIQIRPEMLAKMTTLN